MGVPMMVKLHEPARRTYSKHKRKGMLSVLNRFNISSVSEVNYQPITNKWLLGHFWTLLAQCC